MNDQASSIEDVELAGVKHVLIVDVPADTPAGEAERLLNRPYDENYYLDRTTTSQSGSIRAIYRFRSRNAPSAVAEGAVARALMKSNPKLSLAKLTKLLADNGVKRSTEWIRQQRLSTS
jgi:hypothetical protein